MSRQHPDAERAVTHSLFSGNAHMPDVRVFDAWFVPRIPIPVSTSRAVSVSLRNDISDREPRDLLLPSLKPLLVNATSTPAADLVPPAPRATPPVAATNSRIRNDNTPHGKSLGSHVRALWTAHNRLLRALESLQEVILATPAKLVAEKLRILRSDVNSVLERLGHPITFIKEVEARLDGRGARLETLEQFIRTNKPSPNDPVRDASHHDQLAWK